MVSVVATASSTGCRAPPPGVDSRGSEAQNARCDDGIKNGAETDVDCGGACAERCSVGQVCSADADCKTNVCERSVCEALGVEPTPATPPRDVACECPADASDSDGDCMPNSLEDTNGNGVFDAGDFTNLNNKDTDADGINDGCEDRNRNGVVDTVPAELDPRLADTDGDGIPDGVEDANQNGRYDPDLQETNGAARDTDADGFSDGDEDRNRDGAWNCPENPGGPPCELNPRTLDTDGDGLTDSVELRSTTDARFYLPGNATADADCSNAGDTTLRFAGADQVFGNRPGPDGVLGTADDILADDQTCPWKADSDDDGLPDGLEDRDANGRVSFGETDPRAADSDGDGLADGVEDANRDGLFDVVTETDPVRIDTDNDGLIDGVEDSGGCFIGSCPTVAPIETCNCAFARNGVLDPNETDPRVTDSDGDGLRDGIEDANGDGVCRRNVPRDPPSPNDETCGYDADSDDDSLTDGLEDSNGDGLLDPGETDPRRADPDNDCLPDNYEIFVGTDPFRADSDGDGLPDGLETSPDPSQRFRYDPALRECVAVVCAQTYFKAACPDPNNVDSDGDGVADGFELLSGVAIGEDSNGNGCIDPGETNPCNIPDDPNDPLPPPDVPQPPQIGGLDTTCTLPLGAECDALTEVPDLEDCTCTGSVPSCGAQGACSDPTTCAASSECRVARVQAQTLVCAQGNLKPINVLKSSENDYSIALPAYRDARKEIRPIFETREIGFEGRPVGHVFQSKDAESASLAEPVRSVFGAVLRIGNIRIGAPPACDVVADDPPLIERLLPPPPASGVCVPSSNFVVPNSAQLPSDVAERAFSKIDLALRAAGYGVERTAGGNVDAHDDQSTTGFPTAITVQTATDRYVIKRPGGSVDSYQVSRIVNEALLGGNPYLNALPPPPANQYFRGPVADLRIQFFRRTVYGRELDSSQAYVTFPLAQYGAVAAVAALDADCSLLSGEPRVACKLAVDAARVPVDDLTNGSALARASAVTGSGCELFDPEKSKADFLLVIDDSGSMQSNILAITRAVKDVSLKLRANVSNLDWRIGMTTSTMGVDQNLNPTAGSLSALPDSYEPFHPTYPAPTEANVATVTGNNALFLYQHSAFDAAGNPQRCRYGDAFVDSDPTVSPFCCDIDEPDPLEYARKCCSLPSGNALPAGTQYTGLAVGDGNAQALNAVGNYEGNDTLRCFDFPRYSQDFLPPSFITPYNPEPGEQARHFNDFLCGSPSNNIYRRVFGARGFLWPPGFIGPDAMNPRKDGANLLVRNADMLVMQMNRPCAFGTSTPRVGQGSGFEQPLQALKRTIQRAQAGGRSASPQPYKLRKNTPLFSIVLSDEEDYALKYRNSALPEAADRDLNSLPAARCVNNGDAGCTVNYCQNTCFGNLVDVQEASFQHRIPSARRYTAGRADVDARGAYCTTPFTGETVVVPLAPTGPTGNTAKRYDGFAQVDAGLDENGSDPADLIAGPNGVTRDVLNPNNGAPLSCASTCGGDCGACMRYLREKQYADFFSGDCSLEDGAAPGPLEGRRYEAPAVDVGGGRLVLPLGGFYAITRRAGFQGGTVGACGSTYPGGDGTAYRDVALASGGRVADICLASTPAGFTDFLDEIIVEAQGIGSPYRLRGNPISTTIRVGVLSKTGALRLLPRSSVSGWDFNASSRSIAFFTRGLTGSSNEALADQANQVTVDKDVKVFVSYQVWQRQCTDECAVGDVCALCACTAGTPQCCTATPTFECKPPIVTCNCGSCERCDATTNTCKPSDPCGGCSSGQVCNSLSLECQDSCPPDSVAVSIPCEGGSCGSVCITQRGVPNPGGGVCVAGVSGQCCGSETACAGNEVCVLTPCLGESCISEAECKPLGGAGEPGDDFCNPPCPFGSVCAPKPCAAESCPPIFQCLSDAAPTQCIAQSECSCVGPCADCALSQTCSNGTCVDLCPPGESAAACCARANVQCCPAGEQFNPATGTCVPQVACDPACPAGTFCDVISGRCLPKGG